MTHLVVDGMNVIGSRPDGWWRDRDGAARRLLGRLQAYAARDHIDVTLVLDGPGFAGLHGGELGGVLVLFAREAGFATADDYIVELLERSAGQVEVEVVTSDRALRHRVQALGARVGSPRALLRRLDALDV